MKKKLFSETDSVDLGRDERFSIVNSLRRTCGRKFEFIVVFPARARFCSPSSSVFQTMQCKPLSSQCLCRPDLGVQGVSAVWSAVRRAALGPHSKALSFLGLVEIVFCWGGRFV